MTREFAVEAGIDAEDIPSPPALVGRSTPAEENETRAQIADWQSAVREMGLDPAAALRIVSAADPSLADANALPANADDDAAARSATQSALDRFTAARDAAPSVLEGWRPSSLFATDSAADEREDADDAPARDRPTGVFAEPERTDAAVERDRADALPGIGPGERVQRLDIDADGDLDEHRDAIRSSTGDYRGKAGPGPTSAQSSRPSYQTGVNYVGGNSAQSGGGEDAEDEDDRPLGVFTADPEDDPEGEDDEHRPSGLFTDPEGDDE